MRISRAERKVDEQEFYANCALIDIDRDYARSIGIDVVAVEERRDAEKKRQDFEAWKHSRLYGY